MINTARSFGGNPQESPFHHITPLGLNSLFGCHRWLKTCCPVGRRSSFLFRLRPEEIPQSLPFDDSPDVPRDAQVGGRSCSRSEGSGSVPLARLEHQHLQSDDFSSSSKRSPSTMSSLHELIGTHALCSSRRQSRPTASSAHSRQGSVWSWSCAKQLGTFFC